MITGAARVAGVCGQPIAHSLSPVLHNAWIAEAGIDAAYVPFAPPEGRFEAFVDGLRGGVVRGLNVTIPFKERALALADEASAVARRAGASNLLLFRPDGTIFADNTDGVGLLEALKAQANYEAKTGPVVLLGAGGAARGAAAALIEAGAPSVRIINRTLARAQEIAAEMGAGCSAHAWDDAPAALADAALVVNATSLGLGGRAGPDVDLDAAPASAVVMDMVFKPLRTEFLERAAASGRRTVDGLEMLVRQAVPSFEAFFGQVPPASVDVRALALKALDQ
ncbi:shikimate dehydrogenase [Caulobacter segnis]|uniref:shikimate dehydrogenase n=1 Tax=Caulobacter segnis TaxID=88688 RepID=UPI00240EA1FD|nr:shikimate dehydrogenase [Caulobacter segnis]MDG2521526.1 shikimate dehydrogenase [Caulobacter segnis]